MNTYIRLQFMDLYKVVGLNYHIWISVIRGLLFSQTDCLSTRYTTTTTKKEKTVNVKCV